MIVSKEEELRRIAADKAKLESELERVRINQQAEYERKMAKLKEEFELKLYHEKKNTEIDN